MLPLYERIKTMRLKNKLSQETLAKLTGYKDRSSIAKIEKGLVDLSETKINIFARALNTTPEYLMGWTEQKSNIIKKVTTNMEKLTEKNQTKTFEYTEELLKEQIQPTITMEINEEKKPYKIAVTEKVSAGRGYSYGDNEVEYYEIDTDDLPSYDFATLISGDSMEPLYNDGEIILIKQGYNNVNGDVYVIDYDGESYVKKLYNEGTRFVLKSINEKYEDIIIYISDIQDTYFNIVGKVVGSVKPL